jgi:hypothetical protein
VTADQPIPDAPPHGTLRGWSMGSRCMFCASAKSATVPVSDAREFDEPTGEIPQSAERTTTTG